MVYLVFIETLAVIALILVLLVVFRKVIPNKLTSCAVRLVSIFIYIKDTYTEHHQLHTAALAELLYKQLPKNIKRKVNKWDLYIAARIHDCGKNYVSDLIICSPNQLTEDQFEEIKTHVILGSKIAEEIFSKRIANIVIAHHERIDSNGYLGFPAEDIPIESKMISVCDTFSALCSNRSYKKALSINEALDVLRECRGTQLDAEMVDYFLGIGMNELMLAMNVYGRNVDVGE